MAAAWLGITLISATDICFRRIPKHLNYALTIGLLLWYPDRSKFFLVIFCFYLILRILSKYSLGYGDIRFAPAISLLSSTWENCIFVNTLAWVLAGGWVLFARQIFDIKWGATLPFAPFLALSALLEAS